MSARATRTGAGSLALALALVACSPSADDAAHARTAAGSPTYAEQGCDDAAFLRARAARADGTEVTVCGHVVAARGDVETRGGLHKQWRIDVRDRHDPVEIDSNEDLEGRFTASVGDYAVVRGTYYADPDGRDGIHYTHRDPRGRHDAGFVLVGGRFSQ